MTSKEAQQEIEEHEAQRKQWEKQYNEIGQEVAGLKAKIEELENYVGAFKSAYVNATKAGLDILDEMHYLYDILTQQDDEN